MSDIGLAKQLLFFKPPQSEIQHLHVFLNEVKQRLATIAADAIVPTTIINDLKFLIRRNSREALEIMANILLSRRTEISLREKLNYLEKAAEFNADAAWLSGYIYLGLQDDATEYLDDEKALYFLKLASKLAHKKAYSLLISAMLQGHIKVDEEKFIAVCKEMVKQGDMFAGLYCAAVLCHYYPPSVKDHVRLQITKNIELANIFIHTVIAYGRDNDNLMDQVKTLINKGFADKIWPKQCADTFLAIFSPTEPQQHADTESARCRY